MNARVAKEEIALLMPTTLASYADEPRYADDAQRGGVFALLASAVQWIRDLPRRQAVLTELAQLSDHELSDIGLARSELSRVFDRDFASQRASRN